MGESHVCITVSTTSVCALSGDVSKWRDFVANILFLQHCLAFLFGQVMLKGGITYAKIWLKLTGGAARAGAVR